MATPKFGILLVLVVLELFFQSSQGLTCFTCTKFMCEDDDDSCFEMRHLASSNDKNRELTARWRNSPKCPEADEDLRWDRHFLQNCTAQENACGSFYIKVTASVAKNSINESEYPILVTPTYHYSTIVALGCMKAGETPVEYEVETTSTPLGNQTTTPDMHPHGNYSTNHTHHDNHTATASGTNSTVLWTNSTDLDNTVYKTQTDSAQQQSNVTSNSTSSNSTMTTEGYAALPTPQAFVDLLMPFLVDSTDIIPDHKLSTCSPLNHEENRTSYETLVRINITGEYALCKSCYEDLCNSEVPTESHLITTTTEPVQLPTTVKYATKGSTEKPTPASGAAAIMVSTVLTAVAAVAVYF